MHIITDIDKEHHYAIKLAFKTNNDEAEYEALLDKLAVVEMLGANEMEVRANFQVVVNQFLGGFSKKGKKLKKYLQLVWEKCNHFWYAERREPK